MNTPKEGKDISKITSQGGQAQSKGVTRYLDSQEDSTLIFELSKDLSHTRLENTKEVQRDKMEVFPPKGLK